MRMSFPFQWSRKCNSVGAAYANGNYAVVPLIFLCLAKLFVGKVRNGATVFSNGFKSSWKRFGLPSIVQDGFRPLNPVPLAVVREQIRRARDE